MIKTVFRSHPIMIWRLIKRYLFILIIPLVRAVVQYLTQGEVDGLLAIETVAVGFLLTVAVLGWRSIKITVSNDCIIVEKGIFIKTCAKIDVSRLSSISLRQGALDFLFGSVSCAINTEAGRPQKSDFDIKMSVSDAKMLYNLVYDTKNMETIKFSTLRIALLAATTSSAVTGIVIGVPVLNEISKFIGIAVSDMLLTGIDATASKFDNFFPPIVNLITIIAVSAYAISFVASFFKNVNFRLKSEKDNIEVQSGFIARKKIMFAKSKVNNVCLEQTPLMRLVNKHCMTASIGGYGDGKGEKAVIIPVAKRQELVKRKKMLFPLFKVGDNQITPIKKAFNLRRFIYIPVLIAYIIVGIGMTLIIIFPYTNRLIVFLMCVALGVDLYYCGICYRNYKSGWVCFGKCLSASGSIGFTVRELYCERKKVGIIKITQTPADKRYNTCKVKITIRSEGADSVKIKNIDKTAVLKQIKTNFNE